MDMHTTLIGLGIGLAIAAVAALGDSVRRRAPLAWHAHLPWNGLAFAGVAIALFALVHLFNLARQQ